MRIWFNKTFSSIHSVLRNIRNTNQKADLTLVFSHTHSHAPGRLIADESYLEPDNLTQTEYVEWSLRFCEQKNIDLFWPGKAVRLIIENRERFSEIGVKIVAVAQPAVMELLNNKANFYKQLDHNIAVPPDSILVNTAKEFEQAYQTLKQKHKQICVKPAISVFGLGFKLIDEQRDSITHLLSGVEYQIPYHELLSGMVQAEPFGDLLVMEYLDGHEWSVDCVASNGTLCCAIQRKKPLAIGHGQFIDNQPEIAGMVTRLTSHFALNGLYNIQFKQGANGPKLLEINPRPSGGVGMAMLAGVDLANIALHAVLDENPPSNMAEIKIEYGRWITEINTPHILEIL